MDNDAFEVIVVGAGPAGLTAAIALAQSGFRTALCGPVAVDNNRTTALLGGSIRALETLEVWQRCHALAAPLASIRIVDDRESLVRAPEVLFHAEEIGLAAFGQNLENRLLVDALLERLGELPIVHMPSPVVEVTSSESSVAVRLATGEPPSASLLIAADGRNSICRQAAGISVEDWDYPQSALTCNLAHARPHGSVSTEFHTRTGPFTLVPMQGESSSLVWVLDRERAAAFSELKPEDFALAVERQAHSFLGKMSLTGTRQLFPLSGLVAQQFAKNRVALVAEAAHVIPPIGAQGFNLGLRDVATITELLVAARREHAALGGPELLARYDAMRRPDIWTRVRGIDLLNRSLLTDFLPTQALRGLGLALLQRIGPLRRAAMREGVMPRASEPLLIRGERLA
jgi:2-octaprenyl-6-methoxyphenol hydroxylase